MMRNLLHYSYSILLQIPKDLQFRKEDNFINTLRIYCFGD